MALAAAGCGGGRATANAGTRPNASGGAGGGADGAASVASDAREPRDAGDAGGAAAGDPAGGPRNLLLVTLDTVRADHLGCYGDALAETPALDRLASEGIRFAHAASPVPLTLPSHTSILTGLLPLHHGVRNNGAAGLPAGTATLATTLAGAGYRTGAFVAAFVLDHRFGLQPGFAVYDDEVNRDPNAGWVLEAERPGNVVVDRALAWLGRDDARPFFLWVHLYDAHAPYNAPSPQRERHPGRPYDGAVAFDDAQLGRLLAELDRRGWRERTVVAVTADHGESLGEHGEATHGLLLYEPDLAVPLLLRAPGLAPRAVATPVSLVDLAPTLAGLLRLPWTRPADGRDLSAALTARREPPPIDLYAETRYPEVFGWSPLAALRRRDLKYISGGGGAWPELYDLTRDPHEAVNLAGTAGTAAPAAARGHAASAAAAGPAAGPAAGFDAATALRGFATRLAEIEATTVRRRPGAAGVPRGATPAPPDAETRARLASLGYVASSPATGAAGTSAAVAAGATAAAPAAGAAPRGPDSRRQVELFQRFERAHDEQLAGKADAALADLEAVVAADPPNAVFRAKLAQALRERGRLDRAIPLYRRAAADAAGDPEAWYNLASALQEAGQLGEARAAIERALRLDPGRAEAHNTLGIVLLGEQRPQDARREFAAATAADPRNAHAWNNLGNVLRGLGRLGEAEQAYRRALAVAPNYPEAWNGLGTLAVERDQPAAAVPFFDRALALAPGYQEVRLNRAIALQMAGDRAAAADAYRDYLRATDSEPRQFAEQRQAARHFLEQLSTAAAPPARRPAGGR
ncbi:MAG TPA: sulfatase-like hydrolase/transferase [Thermoanaerobaculia bacterium]|nr:sulfatase-like hydrolase/transferase [Thermoanaerobaculia bacterium]